MEGKALERWKGTQCRLFRPKSDLHASGGERRKFMGEWYVKALVLW